jgi:hypothetical protein
MTDAPDATPKKKWVAAFLRALAEDGNVTRSAEIAGIERSTAYRAYHNVPSFAADWDDALKLGTGALEDEARRRALQGSDTLLIFMLKSHKPDVYRETVNQRYEGGIKISVTYADASTDD